jgi:hypothetical protein
MDDLGPRWIDFPFKPGDSDYGFAYQPANNRTFVIYG